MKIKEHIHSSLKPVRLMTTGDELRPTWESVLRPEVLELSDESPLGKDTLAYLKLADALLAKTGEPVLRDTIRAACAHEIHVWLFS